MNEIQDVNNENNYYTKDFNKFIKNLPKDND